MQPDQQFHQSIARAEAAFAQEDYEGALAAFEQARELALDPARQGQAHAGCGASLAFLGRLDEAQPCCEAAISLTIEALGEDAPELIEPYTNLASVLAMRGEPEALEQAITCWERALALERAHPQAQPASLAATLADLASAYMMADRPEQALASLTEAITHAERAGDDPSAPQALVMRLELAQLHDGLSQPEQAADQVRRVLDAASAAPASLELALASRTLATILSRQGRCDEAELLFAHAEQQLSQAPDEDAAELDGWRERIAEERALNLQFKEETAQAFALWARMEAQLAEASEDDAEEAQDDDAASGEDDARD